MTVTKSGLLALASTIEWNPTAQALADGIMMLAAAVAATMPDDAAAPAADPAPAAEPVAAANVAPAAEPTADAPAPAAPAEAASPADELRAIADKLPDDAKVYATMIREVADAIDPPKAA